MFFAVAYCDFAMGALFELYLVNSAFALGCLLGGECGGRDCWSSHRGSLLKLEEEVSSQQIGREVWSCDVDQSHVCEGVFIVAS